MIAINLPLFSLFSLIIVTIINGYDVEPPETVVLPLSSVGERFSVKLKTVHSYLANENLPVWTVDQHNAGQLKKINAVMESLGKFTMYQNKERSTAAVFFHNSEQFSGVVGAKYVVHKLPYINGDKKLYPSEATLFRQPESPFLDVERKKLERISRDIKSGNETDSRVRTRRSYRDTVFLEILVMVDYSMITQNILTSFSINKYTDIVSHVLTLFNSVDMLYSKVESPRIKINIAGIIIADEADSFKSVVNKNCLRTQKWTSVVPGEQLIIQTLGATCTHQSIISYLAQFANDYEFRNLFNHVMFLTSLPLHGDDKEFILPPLMKGIHSTINTPDAASHDKFWRIRLGIITAERYSANYIAAAHELAHALSVDDHDSGPYVDENDECNAFIMRPDDDYCHKCLLWSPRSLQIMKKYFESPESCVYRDDPRSLHSGPYETFDADEQCRCHGFHSAKKPSLMKRINFKPSDVCEKYLKCKNEHGVISPGPFPMDGTPCGTNKVCWTRKCTTVVQFHRTHSCRPRS